MRHPSLRTLALAACLSVSPASAAPLPELALPAARHAALPSAAFPVPDSYLGVCGTRFGAVADAISRDAARTDVLAQPTSHSTDSNGIAVLEDDGTFFYTHNSDHPKVDLQAVSRAFYRSHGDDYDVLAVFLPSGMSDWLGSPTAFAAAFPVKNTITGLNEPLFDESAGMGSAGRLELLMSMNGLDRYPDDPNQLITAYGLGLTGEQTIGHEFQHRWGAYVQVESLGQATNDILGRDFQHWSFFLDSDASVLDGCNWIDAGSDSFWIDEVQDRYGRLDQYLMGVRKPEEVGPMLLVTQPTDIQPPGNWNPMSIPTVGVGCRATPRWFTIDDVIAANGPRVPAAPDTVPVFRIAFVLAIPRDATPDPHDLARLDSLRADFVPWIETATGGRGRVDTRLAPTPPRVLIAHTPLGDTEDTVSPRMVGFTARTIGGNLPAAVDPGSARVRWRQLGDPSFMTIPASSAGPDSFTATLPAIAGDAEYAIDAATAPGIASASLPAGSQTFKYHAGPDVTPPVVTHVPVRLQVPWALPQTLLARADDGLGVDSVWVEYAVDGGPLQSAATTRAGADTFRVALGGGMTRGSRLTYRFAARDVSAAHNLGYSNVAFDTLATDRDYFEDFENGERLVHDSSIWSYRDAWHAETDPLDPARGTGMHAGDPGGGPYAPHLDASLYTPYLYGIPAGAVLQFDHRYQLESDGTGSAWDGALLEYSVNGGAWQQLMPVAGYPLTLGAKVSTVPSMTPVWSGDSNGWRTEFASLDPLGPGPAIVRWRMVTDEFIGRDGWRVDHVRITWPDGSAEVPVSPGADGIRTWPNPARASLSVSYPALAGAGDGAWELYDISGRRVAALWSGRFATGGGTLRAAIPDGVGSGLYFARLRNGARVIANTRVAVVR